ESSQVGAVLELGCVPRPPGVEEFKWLTTFPSFGFLLACEATKVQALLRHFQNEGIAAASVGHFDGTRQVRVKQGAASAVVWDLTKSPLTGFMALSTRGKEPDQYEEAS